MHASNASDRARTGAPASYLVAVRQRSVMFAAAG